ncbi:MAG: TldD/PmbA family protein [Bacillota bacterium]
MGKLTDTALEVISSILAELRRERGIYAIIRCQERVDTEVLINNGKTERIRKTDFSGMGVQVFTEDGYTGFVSYDRIVPGMIRELVEKAWLIAVGRGDPVFLSNREIFTLNPVRGRYEMPSEFGPDDLEIEAWDMEVKNLNRTVDPGTDAEFSIQTYNLATREAWRIFRSDGTDVYFETPRAALYHSMTVKKDGNSVNASANVSGADLHIIRERAMLAKLSARTGKALSMAVQLLDAPRIKKGSYKILIDYAMAKGLAHEAFGHASESDHAAESVLATDGVFRLGEKVAADNVTIIDGPVRGDYAYCPVSANGEIRENVEIVKNGRLHGGLGDIFSAREAGIEPSGAARAQSYQSLPMPRMSNIRLTVADPIPLGAAFEEVTPADLYHLLKSRSLIGYDEKVIYLAGYGGGQVNPATGDFVFNCSGVYGLAEKPHLYQPAIFSGNVLSALQSIICGIGPVEATAVGTCGKMGQGVPSSGGGNCFILMDVNDEVEVGGE